MSKMNELSRMLDTLVSCGNSMIEVANALREYYSGAMDQQVAEEEKRPETVPAEPEKEIEFVDVRMAFSAKSHAGYTEQVRALIGKYGADRLSAVKKEDYAAILADLEAIQ